MANEETPSYIGYGEAENGSYEGKDLTAFFKFALKTYGISWLPTIKESSLAKRMVKEYGQHKCEAMAYKWMIAKRTHGVNFTEFYMKRHEIAESLQPKDYDDWDD